MPIAHPGTISWDPVSSVSEVELRLVVVLMVQVIVEFKVTCRVMVMNLEDVLLPASRLYFQLDSTFIVVDHVLQFLQRPTAIGGVLENN